MTILYKTFKRTRPAMEDDLKILLIKYCVVTNEFLRGIRGNWLSPVCNYFIFRWFLILAFMLCILFIVILIHDLVEKCNKYWRNNVSDSVIVENQETDSQYSIVDFYTVVFYIIIISSICIIIK